MILCLAGETVYRKAAELKLLFFIIRTQPCGVCANGMSLCVHKSVQMLQVQGSHECHSVDMMRSLGFLPHLHPSLTLSQYL